MLVQAITSRTVWTGIVMFALTWGPGISALVPQEWKPLIDAALSLLMFYFHVNPSRSYGKSVLQK